MPVSVLVDTAAEPALYELVASELRRLCASESEERVGWSTVGPELQHRHSTAQHTTPPSLRAEGQQRHEPRQFILCSYARFTAGVGGTTEAFAGAALAVVSLAPLSPTFCPVLLSLLLLPLMLPLLLLPYAFSLIVRLLLLLLSLLLQLLLLLLLLLILSPRPWSPHWRSIVEQAPVECCKHVPVTRAQPHRCPTHIGWSPPASTA